MVDAGIEGIFQDWAVECPNCHIALIYHDDGYVSTILEAVTAWNRRAESVDSAPTITEAEVSE